MTKSDVKGPVRPPKPGIKIYFSGLCYTLSQRARQHAIVIFPFNILNSNDVFKMYTTY